MELIYSDPYYGTKDWREGRYASELTSALTEFDPSNTATDANIGHGADWPVVLIDIFNQIDWSSLLTLASASGLFFLGENINKNIDAWIEIARKLKKLIDKRHPARIDENAAIMIVLNELFGAGQQHSQIDISLQIIEFTLVPWGKRKLSRRPDALYVIKAQVPKKVIIYGIKSNASIAFTHEYSTAWHDFRDDNH